VKNNNFQFSYGFLVLNWFLKEIFFKSNDDEKFSHVTIFGVDVWRKFEVQVYFWILLLLLLRKWIFKGRGEEVKDGY
jgi:hypothetical protein